MPCSLVTVLTKMLKKPYERIRKADFSSRRNKSGVKENEVMRASPVCSKKKIRS
jgi:hypothetical protein